MSAQIIPFPVRPRAQPLPLHPLLVLTLFAFGFWLAISEHHNG